MKVFVSCVPGIVHLMSCLAQLSTRVTSICGENPHASIVQCPPTRDTAFKQDMMSRLWSIKLKTVSYEDCWSACIAVDGITSNCMSIQFMAPQPVMELHPSELSFEPTAHLRPCAHVKPHASLPISLSTTMVPVASQGI